MKQMRIIFGKILFWLSWPALYVYLLGSLRSRVVIEANGEILLLQGWYDGNKWSLPGGGVHKNELPVDSAIRETSEETGIKLQKNQLISLGSSNYKHHGLHFNLIQFGCRLKSKPPIKKQQLEVLELEWIKISKITSEMVNEATWRHLTTWKQHR